MVSSCVIKNCGSVWIPNSGLSYFRFPLNNADLLEKWLKVIPKEVFSKVPTVHSRICSKHFLPDFLVPVCAPSNPVKMRLAKDAIPSIFEIDGHDVIVAEVSSKVILENDENKRFSKDLEQVKNKWDVSVQTLPILFKSPAEEHLRKEVKQLKYRLYRQELKINSLREILMSLGIEKNVELNGDFSIVRKSIEKQMKKDAIYSNKVSGINIDTVCRSCLLSGKNESILKLKFDGQCINDLLEQIFSVKVSETDKFRNVCLLCYVEIIRAYIFLKRCQKSERILQSFISQDNSTNCTVLKNDFDELDNENDDAYSISSNDGQDLTSDNVLTKGHFKNDLDEVLIQKNIEINIEKDVEHFEEEISTSTPQDISNDTKISICEVKVDLEGKETSVKQKSNRKNTKNRKRKCTGKSSVSCKVCNITFGSSIEFRKHCRELKHSQERKCHACIVCNKQFTSSKLKLHMRIHTKEQPYKCNVCHKRFNLRGNLNRHMMIHTGERPHICDLCGKGFIQLTTLNTHKKVHLSEATLKHGKSCDRIICSICGRLFKRLGPFLKHMKKRHSDQNPETYQEKIENEPRDYICEICNGAFKQKHHLKAHMRIHGERKYLCSDCGKSYATKPALDSHLRVHTGEKPYKCLVCSKSFAHISTFDSHMYTHTGEKPHMCTFCPKRFTQLTHLTYHLRTHSGERPYSCTFCGKSFALKGNLTVHTRMHTGETPYICSVCDRGFYDSNSMKKHKRAQHGVFPEKVKETFCEEIAGNVEIVTSTGTIINTDLDNVIAEFNTDSNN